MPVKKSNLVFLCFLLISLLVFPLSWSAAAMGPEAQLKLSVDKLLTVLNDKQLQGPEKTELRRQKVAEVAFSQFNMTRMAKLCLGRGWRKLTPEQRQEFTRLFKRMLAKTYVSTIDDYSGQKVVFTREIINKDRAEVRSKIVSDDKEIPINYRMKLEGDRWLIYDVIIENVSLVRNYRSQFAPLMQKKGYDGLIEQMKKRIKEIESGEKKNNG
ncbi:MAG: ABC transporter substrate-binding protein [Deltaproteobacteria bacterium]|nr:ABC transporter substrate-binding protein [Deltaproteobacteria bacterium]